MDILCLHFISFKFCCIQTAWRRPEVR